MNQRKEINMDSPGDLIPQRPFSRRAFLGAAAALTAAPATIGRARQVSAQPAAVEHPTASRSRIYKSLKWGMIQMDGSLEEKFATLRELGFDGAEIDSPGGVDPKQARAAAERAGLMVDGVVDSTHWQVRMSDPDPATREKSLQDLLTAMHAAHDAGGTTVLLVPGHGNDGTKAEVKSRAIEQIKQALPTAARLGVFILIENVWNHMFYQHDGPSDQTADELADFVDALASPWVGVQFDIGNHQKYGLPAQWIRRLGPRIVKLDAKDWGQKNGFCKIGDGDVDWDDVRAALAEIGFHGWAAAEVAGGGRERLEDISQRMDRAFGLKT
jgi:hexulose-6-phosphate isomerase